MTHPSAPAPTLVVLAAGLGSRFGGLKQMEVVRPGGATLMDYAVFDAVRSGFGKVVFVIRTEMETAFRDNVFPRFAAHVALRTAHQRLDAPLGLAVPPGRTKPWGTAHAVLAAAEEVSEPFAVVNADDFYGQAAYRRVAEFLTTTAEPDPPTYAIVGFPLAGTVSDAGPVNRAVCHTSPDGWLRSVVEVLHIAGDGEDYRGEESGQVRHYDGTELVSMNMWGFTPEIFAQARAGFAAFLEDAAVGQENAPRADLARREFLIPDLVQGLVREGRVRVRVIATDSRWTGITHPGDRDIVAERLKELVQAGEYPERLWESA